jgi:hypothetical protein
MDTNGGDVEAGESTTKDTKHTKAGRIGRGMFGKGIGWGRGGGKG